MSTTFAKLQRLADKVPLWFHILGASLGTLGGAVGGSILTFYFGNYHAGVWCYLSGLAALVLLHILTLHRYKNLEAVHSVKSLGIMKMAAFIVVAVAAVTAIAYLILAIKDKILFFPVEDSWVIAAVQAFVTLKFASGIAYFSRRFTELLIKGYESSYNEVA